jgi:hypothetical protein
MVTATTLVAWASALCLSATPVAETVVVSLPTTSAQAGTIALGEPKSPALDSLAPHERLLTEARRALAAHEPKTVLHLWLLERAMAPLQNEPQEPAFRSALWVALSETGVCPDGLREDDDGDGLWPLAMHNWLVRRARRSGEVALPSAWSTFPARLQTRPISLFDTLSLEELRTARLAPGPCFADRWVSLRLPTLQWLELEDRLSLGLALHDLLSLAERTARPSQLRGLFLLSARRFDLDLALMRLARDRARTDTSVAANLLRSTGLAADRLVYWQQQRDRRFATGSEAGLWTAAAQLGPAAWLDLPDERRARLFLDARETLRAAGVEQAIVLGVLHGLIARRAGLEVQRWLGAVEALPTRQNVQSRLMTGDVGTRLLSLAVADGFYETSVVALHRGVDAVQRGDSLGALRLFALGLSHVDESSIARPLHDLTLRWFSFVVGSYESTPEVLAVVERFVPQSDRSAVLESILWRAAFRVDATSFDRAFALLPPGARALRSTMNLLRPLAHGNVDAAFDAVDDAAVERPRAMLDLLSRLYERLAEESTTLRADNEAVLDRVARALGKLSSATTSASRLSAVERLQGRIEAMLAGIGRWREDVAARARANEPSFETDAGSLRLAPADAMPWPFQMTEPRVADPFSPIAIVPMHWLGADGSVVEGWRLGE